MILFGWSFLWFRAVVLGLVIYLRIFVFNRVCLFLGYIEVRLVGGEYFCVGRLEVRRGLVWGVICDFDLD